MITARSMTLHNKSIVQSDRTPKLRHLHELIAALDRRVPPSSALEKSNRS